MTPNKRDYTRFSLVKSESDGSSFTLSETDSEGVSFLMGYVPGDLLPTNWFIDDCLGVGSELSGLNAMLAFDEHCNDVKVDKSDTESINLDKIKNADIDKQVKGRTAYSGGKIK